MDAFLFLLAGCVLRYAEPPPRPPGTPEQSLAAADFAALDARLQLLMEKADADRDRQLRLEASRDLLRRARYWPRDAQDDLLAYLLVILDIEEKAAAREDMQPSRLAARAVDAGLSASALGDSGEELPLPSPVAAEPLRVEDLAGEAPEGEGASPWDSTDGGGPAGGGEPAPVGGRPVEPVAAAREALSQGDYAAAIEALERLPDPRAPATEGLWREAVDGYVYQARMQAGQRFLQARSLPPGERAEALERVREELQQLLDRFPESTYAGAIRRNLELVERELARQ